MRILPADPAAAARRRAPLSLAGVPVAEALAAVASMPIFGILGQPELEVAEGLEGSVRLELASASWLDALNAVCHATGCRWQLTYGAPSRLAVRPRQKGLEDRVSLPAGATTLGAAAGLLAARLDLEPELNAALDAQAEVRFPAGEAIWKDAASELCRQAGCFWTIVEGRLRLNPRVKALSSRPSAGAEDRLLAVRFFAPDASVPVFGTARFNWVTPIRTVGAGVDERWLARLSWIPFGPGLDLVMPAILRCAGDRAELELLEPVRWPIEKPVTRQWRGAILELSAPSGAGDVAGPVRVAECAGGARGQIRASFRRADSEAGGPETTLDLEARPGAYLLVTPPGTDPQPAPAAAVLALGAGEKGRQRVAILRPEGAGFAVDRRVLPAEGELRETIAAGGVEFELRLSSVD